MTLKLLFDITVLLLVVISICERQIKMKKAPATTYDKLRPAATSFDIAINVCFRFSMTCVVVLEVCSC